MRTRQARRARTGAHLQSAVGLRNRDDTASRRRLVIFACGDGDSRCHALEPYPELAVWQAKVLAESREPSKFRILGAVGVRIFDARPCTFPILCAREFKEISEQAPEQASATRCTCEMKNEYAHEG